MERHDYRSSITARLSPGEAIDRIGRVGDWWTHKGFSGKALEAGDTFTVRFGETSVDLLVSELVPGSRVVWEVKDSHLPWLKDQKEWNHTRIIWEVAREDGGTRITMTHSGLTPQVECYESCKAGWDFYFGKSLLKLLVYNEGLPDGKGR